jgi:regulator of sigma E protease
MHIFLYYVLPFIFVLGILIFFHELGHFLVAKFYGVRVLKFSLGFGPKLLGKKVGDTEYLISVFPLGGYVKMLGENVEEEPLTPEEEKVSFSHQHVLKRIAIVAAGPLFNLLLALLIFCGFFLVSGKQIMVPEIGQITEGSPAEKAGLAKGDVIVSIDNRPIESWSQIKDAIQNSAGETVEVTIRRSGQLQSVSVMPEFRAVKNIFGEEIQSPIMGIVASGRFETVKLTPLRGIQEGIGRTWEIIELTCLTIVKLLQRVVPIKTLGGPILIGQLTGQLAQESLSYLFPFMAVISINLGILNLLPVPILDGGMIIFLLIELAIGKPLSIKKREWAQKVGMFLLFMLMAVVLYNDVVRLFE